MHPPSGFDPTPSGPTSCNVSSMYNFKKRRGLLYEEENKNELMMIHRKLDVSIMMNVITE